MNEVPTYEELLKQHLDTATPGQAIPTYEVLLRRHYTAPPNLAELPPMPDPPKPEQPKILATISPKVCAVEVIKHLSKAKTYAIISVIGAFCILIAATFNPFIASAVTVAMVIPIVLYLRSVIAELTRLKKQYGL